jgi:hypothetical protein
MQKNRPLLNKEMRPEAISEALIMPYPADIGLSLEVFILLQRGRAATKKKISNG